MAMEERKREGRKEGKKICAEEVDAVCEVSKTEDVTVDEEPRSRFFPRNGVSTRIHGGKVR